MIKSSRSKTYQRFYSDADFWKKIAKLPSHLREIRSKALLLWSLLKDPQTPIAHKVMIIAALGYLICPLDVIPDHLMPIGLIDDLAVLTSVLMKLSHLITDVHRLRAGIK